MIINSQFTSVAQQQPLPTLESFGDIILSRIWTPDEPLPFISEALSDTQASGVLWGDDFYLYLYRDIDKGKNHRRKKHTAIVGRQGRHLNQRDGAEPGIPVKANS